MKALNWATIAFLSIGSPVFAQSMQVAEMAADRCMYSEALDFLSKAPATERESRAGLLFQARMLLQLEKGADAVSILSRLKKSPSHAEEAERLLCLGMALTSAKRFADAQAVLIDARKNGADADLVEIAIATILIDQGKLTDAEASLRAILRRSSLLSGALYNLGVVRVRRGDLAEAAALVRQAWYSGMHDPDQLKRDPDLAPLIARKGLLDDLLATTIPKCGTY